MAYSTEQTARSLRAARLAKGLSQRALSEIVGAPQSHISRIENGDVDLRLSSLVEIARALDLEVTLVPRMHLAAVNSIARPVQPDAPGQETTARSSRELERLASTIDRIAGPSSAPRQVAQLKRRVNDLKLLQIPDSASNAVRRINQALEAYADEPGDDAALEQVLHRLQELRNESVHFQAEHSRVEEIRPAYSLDDDDHG